MALCTAPLPAAALPTGERCTKLVPSAVPGGAWSENVLYSFFREEPTERNPAWAWYSII
jgi:hypothetical protein